MTIDDKNISYKQPLKSTLVCGYTGQIIITIIEFAEYLVSSGSDKFRLVVVYRTPYSRVHPINVSTFIEEFADYMESMILTPEPLLITGDINIHVDIPNDPAALKFLDLLTLWASSACEDTHPPIWPYT